MPDNQSRESETQILSLHKDIEHFKYIIEELEKDIKSFHERLDTHQKTDLDFHENVRKKVSLKFDILDCRIRRLERWKWAVWGGLLVFGCMIGYFLPGVKSPGLSLL